MKKYLLGLTAVLFAVVFSAFNVSTMRVDYIFQYDGTSYTSQAAVENEANWDFVSTTPGDLACDDIDIKACRIRVPEAQVNIGTPNTLKSTANVKASLFDGETVDTYYVDLLTGTNVLAKSNQD